MLVGAACGLSGPRGRGFGARRSEVRGGASNLARRAPADTLEGLGERELVVIADLARHGSDALALFEQVRRDGHAPTSQKGDGAPPNRLTKPSRERRPGEPGVLGQPRHRPVVGWIVVNS